MLWAGPARLGRVTTRSALIEGALRLFAKNGFRSTSIADIEAEAGLAPGSGGMYRHFPSKRSLFEAAVEWAEATAYAPAGVDERLLKLNEPKSALRAAAESALVATRRASDFHIAILKAGPDSPLTIEEVGQRLVLPSYRQFAQWLELFADAGAFREVDYDAYAAAALGSVVWFHFSTVMTGATPCAVNEQRFIDAWTQLHFEALHRRS